MTSRERYIRTLTFGNPDRIYYDFGNPRKATLEAWYRQGLPPMPDMGDYGCPQEFRDFVGMDPPPGTAEPELNIEFGPFPAFESRTLEENEKGRLWVDAKGIVMFDAGTHLNTPGFRTRSYVSHPVTSRDDWPQMRDRFDPHDPARYPADWADRAAQLKARDCPLALAVVGLFWGSRDWVGFENLCRMFYDDPDLVHDMMEHITVFTMGVLERVLDDVGIDMLVLNEDMGY